MPRTFHDRAVRVFHEKVYVEVDNVLYEIATKQYVEDYVGQRTTGASPSASVSPSASRSPSASSSLSQSPSASRSPSASVSPS